MPGSRTWDWLWKETPEQSNFLPPAIGFYQTLVQIVAFAAFTEHPEETQPPADPGRETDACLKFGSSLLQAPATVMSRVPELGST